MKRCKYCDRKVSPVYRRNKFSFLMFFFFIIISAGILSIVYFLIWLFNRKPRCPICNAKL